MNAISKGGKHCFDINIKKSFLSKRPSQDCLNCPNSCALKNQILKECPLINLTFARPGEEKFSNLTQLSMKFLGNPDAEKKLVEDAADFPG